MLSSPLSISEIRTIERSRLSNRRAVLQGKLECDDRDLRWRVSLQPVSKWLAK